MIIINETISRNNAKESENVQRKRNDKEAGARVYNSARRYAVESIHRGKAASLPRGELQRGNTRG